MPAKKKSDDNSVSATVFVRCGRVAEGAIYKTALEAVRDAIPVVYELEKKITNVSDVKTGADGHEGRDYEVTFTYKVRKTTDDSEEVRVDKVIDSLKVPATEDELRAASAGVES